jgi:hypothetical protein
MERDAKRQPIPAEKTSSLQNLSVRPHVDERAMQIINFKSMLLLGVIGRLAISSHQCLTIEIYEASQRLFGHAIYAVAVAPSHGHNRFDRSCLKQPLHVRFCTRVKGRIEDCSLSAELERQTLSK